MSFLGGLPGGAVGVGTVIIALTIGPVIQFISRMIGEELNRTNRSAIDIRDCCVS